MKNRNECHSDNSIKHMAPCCTGKFEEIKEVKTCKWCHLPIKDDDEDFCSDKCEDNSNEKIL